MGSTSFNYASLKQLLKDTKVEVLLPTDGEKYEKSIIRWSEQSIKRAAAVVLVSSADDISATLAIVREHKISFTVRGGGHSTSGAASIEDGLVIDLSKMRKVTVNPDAKTIKAEGGTLWEDVDLEAAKYGLATVGGTVNHTGVAGLTLGGGYGYLTGKYGLTIDNLLSVDIVLASGAQVVASKTENPDLFWAIRGAGTNFGAVTAFTFQGYEQKNQVFAGPLFFPPEKLPQIVEFANKFHRTNDGNQALLWGLSAPPPANVPMALTVVFYNGPEEQAKAFFADLFNLEPVANMTSMVPYEKLNSLLNPSAGFEGRKQFGGGAFKLPVDLAFIQQLQSDFNDFVNSHEGTNQSLLLFETIPYKKILEVANHEMAFSNRGEYYNIALMFKWFDPALDSAVRNISKTLVTKTAERLANRMSSEGVGQYGNYANAEVEPEDIYGANVQRLEDLKRKYDPDNLFGYGSRLHPRQVKVVN